MAIQGGKVKVLQANLHHATAASAVVEKCLCDGRADLALIQEPWIANSDILGLNAAGKIISNKSGNRPRACIVYNKNINLLPVTEVCSDDLVAAILVLDGSKARTLVCSAYLPGEKENPAEDLERVVEYARRHRLQLLVGCDANAHHTSWGSSDINSRGNVLYDFLLTNGLHAVNKGCKPTFVTCVRQEVLDITIATNDLARRINDWHVSDEPSMSDHNHIYFDLLGSSSSQKVTFRNPRVTDWGAFRDKLKVNLEDVPKTIKTKESLNIAVTAISIGLIKAYEDSCPIKTMSTKRAVPWWNSKLEKLRSKTRKLFNKAKRTLDWEAYREALTVYNKEIRKSKRETWKKFCEDVNSTPQCARIHKFLAKDKPNQIGLLRHPSGAYTANEKETLNLLVSTHFPGATVENVSSTKKERPGNDDWRRASQIIRPSQVKWAVKTFKPYKSCGADGIFPALLQQGIEMLLPHMIKIFRASYAWGHIPEQWTEVKVIFIPKAGKRDYSQPRSFRPISLSSFLLKTLEKILDKHIRDTIKIDSPIHCTQHAYSKGKSTETALLNLVDRVERAFEDKQIALCAFLDIEGAFDNTPTRTLVQGLTGKRVDQTTVRWVEAMLSNRKAKVSLHGTSLEVFTTRGCPQGGVLSPLLWTLAVDQLLHKMAELRIDTQGYADDLVIIVRGFCQSMISYIMQRAMNIVDKWCRDNELAINAAKTVVVPFTNKRQLADLVKPQLNGTPIEFSKEVKYLGVTLDQKLTWNSHLIATLHKAKIALGISSRLAGKTWGLTPKNSLWLYTAVVRPIITYGCIVWHTKANQETATNKLNAIQRTACLMVTGGMSTSPGAALDAILDLPPLHLHLRMVAAASMHRIATQGEGKWLSKSLGSFQEAVMSRNILGMYTDNMTPQCCLQKLYTVELLSRDNWLKGQVTWKNGSLIWYTDGSKSGHHVGCGVYGERPCVRKSLNLGKYASIFQAEVYAILECADLNLKRHYVNQCIYIHSDSQAALLALSSNSVNSRLVQNCMTVLNSLGENNRVILRWVPGHEGIVGNEIADDLAKAGSVTTTYGPEPFCGIPKSLVKLTLRINCKEQSLEHWNNQPGLNHSKALVRAYDSRFARELLLLSRNKLRILVRALTGHCGLNKHMYNLKISSTRECRFCKEADETPLHLICECEALMRKRSSYLGNYQLLPEELRNISANNIIRFLDTVGIGTEL